MEVLAIKEKYQKVSRFLKSAVTIHDQTQVETVFDFILKPKSESSSRLKRKHKYQVEAFFFYPSQMQVDGINYSRQMFLDDMRPQIRLQEPTFSYGEFKGKNAKHIGSPIVSLKKFMENVQKGKIDRYQTEAVEQVRLFACSFSRFLQRKSQTTLKRLHDLQHLAEDDESYQNQIEQIIVSLDKIYDLLSEWRKLSYEFCDFDDGFLENLKQELRLSNEFFSYRLRDSLSRITSATLKLEPNSFSEKLIKKIKAFARMENWYANKNGYIWLRKNSSTLERERFLVRYGSLKRRMWSVLYLMVRTKSLFNFQKQLGFMIAAAFAAVWAFLANLFMFSSMSKVGIKQYTFENIGAGGLLVLTGFVLAYVLKDRIKDLGREQFKGGFFKKLPDTDEKIQYRSANGKLFNIGNIKEYTRIIGKLNDLPGEIIDQRKTHEEYPGQRDDDGIIQYKKIIKIDGKSLADHEMPIYGIHDIIRYKIDRFTKRMGDELQNYWGLDRKAHTFHLNIPKVYHIDMIISYSRQNSEGRMVHITYDCRRLVINKSGLVRVDSLQAKKNKKIDS